MVIAVGYNTSCTWPVIGISTRIGPCAVHLFVILSMYILGISAYFHDSAACLLHNDHIIAAAQEERFTRKKNDERFPYQAIKYCLDEAGIKLSEIDHIVFYEKPFLKFERLLETYLAFAPLGFVSFIKSMPVWLKEKFFLKKKILRELKSIDNAIDVKAIDLLFVQHHLSHAASAFYPSPFDKAIILTADGVGEWVTTSAGIAEGSKITFVKEIKFPHSLGLLYSAFTYYLGFKVNVDEYKVMGLAPYGEPVYADLILQHIVDVKEDGSFRLDMRYFNYCTGLTMTSGAFDKLFGQASRKPKDEITQFHMDMARSIQLVIENILVKITTGLHQEYQIDNLCMAGGVALNCVANGKILRESGFKNVWIQPAAGDAGGALGAAYAVYFDHLNNSRGTNGHDKMQNALLGPWYKSDDIRAYLESENLQFEELPKEVYYNTIAQYIAQGNVVGYFKGRMEFGPRALGARSIVADPRKANMQSVLNQKIKFRESFRPFAPAVMEEFASVYFDIDTSSPYMLQVANIKEVQRVSLNKETVQIQGFKKLGLERSVIPAVTHVDYSARIQTVNKTEHADFYKLIEAFYKITGCPILVNTSFNRMDEPIVNKPAEAVACFMNTGIDILIIENFIIKKP